MNPDKKEVLTKICDLLEQGKITPSEWYKFKYAIDTQYNELTEKITFTANKDNLKYLI